MTANDMHTVYIDVTGTDGGMHQGTEYSIMPCPQIKLDAIHAGYVL